MRRLVGPILAVLLVAVGFLLPSPIHAHSGRTSVSAVSPAPATDLDPVVPASWQASPPSTEVPWLLLGLVAGTLLGVARARPRRVVAALLVLLLSVLAAESSIHSVHHLGTQEAARCLIAAAAAHLVAAPDHGAPVLPLPTVVLGTLAERRVAPTLGPPRGPDHARAPPFLIA